MKQGSCLVALMARLVARQQAACGGGHVRLQASATAADSRNCKPRTILRCSASAAAA
jgi:hypothetical protein